ncbi:hypothetical protein BLNAU_6542 [Blattamonas nauphoetae]|uniref:Uncharacterized protein n=1 Tax=Blattamonas nauphoetae TaxID=2049346 RepID=A0ABQ9Y482_9EUKA|nr:hypothetical protein BLNAU_6542 [Blattamonas nauphoetae]
MCYSFQFWAIFSKEKKVRRLKKHGITSFMPSTDTNTLHCWEKYLRDRDERDQEKAEFTTQFPLMMVLQQLTQYAHMKEDTAKVTQWATETYHPFIVIRHAMSKWCLYHSYLLPLQRTAFQRWRDHTRAVVRINNLTNQGQRQYETILKRGAFRLWIQHTHHRRMGHLSSTLQIQKNPARFLYYGYVLTKQHTLAAFVRCFNRWRQVTAQRVQFERFLVQHQIAERRRVLQTCMDLWRQKIGLYIADQSNEVLLSEAIIQQKRATCGNIEVCPRCAGVAPNNLIDGQILAPVPLYFFSAKNLQPADLAVTVPVKPPGSLRSFPLLETHAKQLTVQPGNDIHTVGQMKHPVEVQKIFSRERFPRIPPNMLLGPPTFYSCYPSHTPLHMCHCRLAGREYESLMEPGEEQLLNSSDTSPQVQHYQTYLRAKAKRIKDAQEINDTFRRLQSVTQFTSSSFPIITLFQKIVLLYSHFHHPRVVGERHPMVMSADCPIDYVNHEQTRVSSEDSVFSHHLFMQRMHDILNSFSVPYSTEFQLQIVIKQVRSNTRKRIALRQYAEGRYKEVLSRFRVRRAAQNLAAIEPQFRSSRTDSYLLVYPRVQTDESSDSSDVDMLNDDEGDEQAEKDDGVEDASPEQTTSPKNIVAEFLRKNEVPEAKPKREKPVIVQPKRKQQAKKPVAPPPKPKAKETKEPPSPEKMKSNPKVVGLKTNQSTVIGLSSKLKQSPNSSTATTTRSSRRKNTDLPKKQTTISKSPKAISRRPSKSNFSKNPSEAILMTLTSGLVNPGLPSIITEFNLLRNQNPQSFASFEALSPRSKTTFFTHLLQKSKQDLENSIQQDRRDIQKAVRENKKQNAPAVVDASSDSDLSYESDEEDEWNEEWERKWKEALDEEEATIEEGWVDDIVALAEKEDRMRQLNMDSNTRDSPAFSPSTPQPLNEEATSINKQKKQALRNLKKKKKAQAKMEAENDKEVQDLKAVELLLGNQLEKQSQQQNESLGEDATAEALADNVYDLISQLIKAETQQTQNEDQNMTPNEADVVPEIEQSQIDQLPPEPAPELVETDNIEDKSDPDEPNSEDERAVAFLEEQLEQEQIITPEKTMVEQNQDNQQEAQPLSPNQQTIQPNTSIQVIPPSSPNQQLSVQDRTLNLTTPDPVDQITSEEADSSLAPVQTSEIQEDFTLPVSLLPDQQNRPTSIRETEPTSSERSHAHPSPDGDINVAFVEPHSSTRSLPQKQDHTKASPHQDQSTEVLELVSPRQNGPTDGSENIQLSPQNDATSVVCDPSHSQREHEENNSQSQHNEAEPSNEPGEHQQQGPHQTDAAAISSLMLRHKNKKPTKKAQPKKPPRQTVPDSFEGLTMEEREEKLKQLRDQTKGRNQHAIDSTENAEKAKKRRDALKVILDSRTIKGELPEQLKKQLEVIQQMMAQVKQAQSMRLSPISPEEQETFLTEASLGEESPPISQPIPSAGPTFVHPRSLSSPLGLSSDFRNDTFKTLSITTPVATPASRDSLDGDARSMGSAADSVDLVLAPLLSRTLSFQPPQGEEHKSKLGWGRASLNSSQQAQEESDTTTEYSLAQFYPMPLRRLGGQVTRSLSLEKPKRRTQSSLDFSLDRIPQKTVKQRTIRERSFPEVEVNEPLLPQRRPDVSLPPLDLDALDYPSRTQSRQQSRSNPVKPKRHPSPPVFSSQFHPQTRTEQFDTVAKTQPGRDVERTRSTGYNNIKALKQRVFDSGLPSLNSDNHIFDYHNPIINIPPAAPSIHTLVFSPQFPHPSPLSSPNVEAIDDTTTFPPNHPLSPPTLTTVSWLNDQNEEPETRNEDEADLLNNSEPMELTLQNLSHFGVDTATGRHNPSHHDTKLRSFNFDEAALEGQAIRQRRQRYAVDVAEKKGVSDKEQLVALPPIRTSPSRQQRNALFRSQPQHDSVSHQSYAASLRKSEKTNKFDSLVSVPPVKQRSVMTWEEAREILENALASHPQHKAKLEQETRPLPYNSLKRQAARRDPEKPLADAMTTKKVYAPIPSYVAPLARTSELLQTKTTADYTFSKRRPSETKKPQKEKVKDTRQPLNIAVEGTDENDSLHSRRSFLYTQEELLQSLIDQFLKDAEKIFQ